MTRELTKGRIWAARTLAAAADLLQIVVFPLFLGGASSPLDDLVDAAVGALLVVLLGWHWALLPTFAAELIPVLDLFPTWTVAVYYMTRGAGGPGKSWYLGGLSAHQSRRVDLPLSFLGSGRFTARLWKDGPETESNPNQLMTETRAVRSRDTLSLPIAPGGIHQGTWRTAPATPALTGGTKTGAGGAGPPSGIQPRAPLYLARFRRSGL